MKGTYCQPERMSVNRELYQALKKSKDTHLFEPDVKDKIQKTLNMLNEEFDRLTGYKPFFTVLVALCVFLTCVPSKASEGNVVAKVIAAEACGEGSIGMQAVANTIANRSRLWNKTPYEVVTQKNQYFGYTAKNRDFLYTQCQEEADRVAMALKSLPDITAGALYFLTPRERRRSWHSVKTVQIKNHIFYK